jgi:hypothetical protein
VSDPNFRPPKGSRLMTSWPLDEPVPEGWQRSDGMFPLVIWRVATGEPADNAVEIEAYTSTADCGLSSVANAKRGKKATARSA